MHKKVQVIIISTLESPHLLLLKTNPKRGSFWQNVTGSVEKNEDFLHAAKRELQEETGICDAELEKLDYSFTFKSPLHKKDVLEQAFLAKIKNRPKIILDGKEHEDFAWIELNAITRENYKYESNFIAFQKSLLLLN